MRIKNTNLDDEYNREYERFEALQREHEEILADIKRRDYQISLDKQKADWQSRGAYYMPDDKLCPIDKLWTKCFSYPVAYEDGFYYLYTEKELRIGESGVEEWEFNCDIKWVHETDLAYYQEANQ